MTSGAYITRKVRQKNDWKAPYGPVPESVPGLFFWKAELKETHKQPPYGLKNLMWPENWPQNKDHLAIRLGTDLWIY